MFNVQFVVSNMSRVGSSSYCTIRILFIVGDISGYTHTELQLPRGHDEDDEVPSTVLAVVSIIRRVGS